MSSRFSLHRGKSVDMTKGNVIYQVVMFAIPILLGQIFQNLYNSVDSIVVGNFVGVTALAAVTSCSDISHLIVGFFTGLSTGSGVLFSRYFGSKDYRKLHDAIHTGITFAIILGVIMTVLGIVGAPLLLELVGCPEDVYPLSLQYLRVYLIGLLFTSMYNVASGVLRSVGDSGSPFYYLVISSITNIVLDLVLVCGLGMGVSGVAVATVISQLVSVILVLTKMLWTTDVYRLVPKELHMNKQLLMEIMSLGLPAAVQTCMIATSNLVVQRYLNSFGSAAMAGSGAAKKIDKYVGMIGQSLGLTMATFISQNMGAGKPERAFKGIRSVMALSLGYIVILGIPIYYNADFCVRIFTDEPEAVAYGALMIHTMMPFYYVQSMHQIFGNVVRGFGKSIVTMCTTIFGLIVCRQIFLAITMSMNYRIENVYLGYPVGWFCSAALAMGYYLITVRIPYIRSKRQ